MERYGVENYSQTDEFKTKLSDKYKNISESERQELNNKIEKTMFDRYGAKKCYVFRRV